MEKFLETHRIKGINATTLKIIAILGMTSDHAAIVFDSVIPFWLKTLMFSFGGLTFPIMAFLIVEGYKHTSNFKKYALRLLGFAIITAVPFMWAMSEIRLNVMFTLFLGLITLYLYDNIKNRMLFKILFVGIIILTYFMDWNLIGVPMVLLYYKIDDKFKKCAMPVLLPNLTALTNLIFAIMSPTVTVVQVIPTVAFTVIGCSLTIPLLYNYNGERGKGGKYFFYTYYPLHLVVLAILRGLFLNDWGIF